MCYKSYPVRYTAPQTETRGLYQDSVHIRTYVHPEWCDAMVYAYELVRVIYYSCIITCHTRLRNTAVQQCLVNYIKPACPAPPLTPLAQQSSTTQVQHHPAALARFVVDYRPCRPTHTATTAVPSYDLSVPPVIVLLPSMSNVSHVGSFTLFSLAHLKKNGTTTSR